MQKTVSSSAKRLSSSRLYKDELTGLYNMNGFYQKWEENNTPSKQQSFVVLYNGFWKKKEENNTPKKQQSFVLLYSDICQFKFIQQILNTAVTA